MYYMYLIFNEKIDFRSPREMVEFRKSQKDLTKVEDETGCNKRHSKVSWQIDKYIQGCLLRFL